MADKKEVATYRVVTQEGLERVRKCADIHRMLAAQNKARIGLAVALGLEMIAEAAPKEVNANELKASWGDGEAKLDAYGQKLALRIIGEEMAPIRSAERIALKKRGGCRRLTQLKLA